MASIAAMPALAGTPTVTVVDYDSSSSAEYASNWGNIYGPLMLAFPGNSLTVGTNGVVTASSPVFNIGADFSVFDHLKYIAVSNQAFEVPETGSLTFSVDIRAQTPGTEAGRVIHGCYLPDPSQFWDGIAPCNVPWEAEALQGQQAGVVLNMINFATGQLFDWFVAGNTAFALVERLPSNVTAPQLQPGDPGYVGLDKAYTQIVREIPIKPGQKVNVSITYTRGPTTSRVDYFMQGKLVASVNNVGVPLDTQGVPYTGIYPSTAVGEPLKDQLDSFVIGHGLFSLLDAFPFQHPESPGARVSIPLSERLFGQGAIGEFSHFKVRTVRR